MASPFLPLKHRRKSFSSDDDAYSSPVKRGSYLQRYRQSSPPPFSSPSTATLPPSSSPAYYITPSRPARGHVRVRSSPTGGMDYLPRPVFAPFDEDDEDDDPLALPYPRFSAPAKPTYARHSLSLTRTPFASSSSVRLPSFRDSFPDEAGRVPIGAPPLTAVALLGARPGAVTRSPSLPREPSFSPMPYGHGGLPSPSPTQATASVFGEDEREEDEEMEMEDEGVDITPAHTRRFSTSSERGRWPTSPTRITANMKGDDDLSAVAALFSFRRSLLSGPINSSGKAPAPVVLPMHRTSSASTSSSRASCPPLSMSVPSSATTERSTGFGFAASPVELHPRSVRVEGIDTHGPSGPTSPVSMKMREHAAEASVQPRRSSPSSSHRETSPARKSSSHPPRRPTPSSVKTPQPKALSSPGPGPRSADKIPNSSTNVPPAAKPVRSSPPMATRIDSGPRAQRTDEDKNGRVQASPTRPISPIPMTLQQSSASLRFEKGRSVSPVSTAALKPTPISVHIPPKHEEVVVPKEAELKVEDVPVVPEGSMVENVSDEMEVELPAPADSGVLAPDEAIIKVEERATSPTPAHSMQEINVDVPMPLTESSTAAEVNQPASAQEAGMVLDQREASSDDVRVLSAEENMVVDVSEPPTTPAETLTTSISRRSTSPTQRAPTQTHASSPLPEAVELAPPFASSSSEVEASGPHAVSVSRSATPQTVAGRVTPKADIALLAPEEPTPASTTLQALSPTITHPPSPVPCTSTSALAHTLSSPSTPRAPSPIPTHTMAHDETPNVVTENPPTTKRRESPEPTSALDEPVRKKRRSVVLSPEARVHSPLPVSPEDEHELDLEMKPESRPKSKKRRSLNTAHTHADADKPPKHKPRQKRRDSLADPRSSPDDALFDSSGSPPSSSPPCSSRPKHELTLPSPSSSPSLPPPSSSPSLPPPSSSPERSMSTPVPTPPLAPDSEMNRELLGVLIETFISSRASALTPTSLWRDLSRARPYLSSQYPRKAGPAALTSLLQNGAASTGVFAAVPRAPGTGRHVEDRWFYVPECDDDPERGSAARAAMPERRSETRKGKRYYWKPLEKISRWDAEDAI